MQIDICTDGSRRMIGTDFLSKKIEIKRLQLQFGARSIVGASQCQQLHDKMLQSLARLIQIIEGLVRFPASGRRIPQQRNMRPQYRQGRSHLM
jgi:hypothetical protein